MHSYVRVYFSSNLIMWMHLCPTLWGPLVGYVGLIIFLTPMHFLDDCTRVCLHVQASPSSSLFGVGVFC